MHNFQLNREGVKVNNHKEDKELKTNNNNKINNNRLKSLCKISKSRNFQK